MQKDIELPREKLFARGAAALTDEELLMIIVGSGGKGNDYRKISKNLSSAIKKIGAKNIRLDDIKEVKGIGDAKSSIIFAALEYWRRQFTKSIVPIIDTPEKAAEQLNNIRNKKQEHFALLTLDGARRLIENRIISIGTLTASIVHPREVYALAIEDRAASIIIAHNHPSGNLEISNQDREVTSIIHQAGKIMGIPLDDHLILSGEEYVRVVVA